MSRELDMRVATSVMGFTSTPCDGDPCEYYSGWACSSCSARGMWGDQADHLRQPPHYSTDVSAAFEIVEKVDFRLELTEYDPGDGLRWVAKFMGPGHVAGKAESNSAPEAICLAALRVTGVKTEEI